MSFRDIPFTITWSAMQKVSYIFREEFKNAAEG